MIFPDNSPIQTPEPQIKCNESKIKGINGAWAKWPFIASQIVASKTAINIAGGVLTLFAKTA